jgi:hypothetical protein
MKWQEFNVHLYIRNVEGNTEIPLCLRGNYPSYFLAVEKADLRVFRSKPLIALEMLI